MKLRNITNTAQPSDSVAKTNIEIFNTDQIEKCSLRIRPGDNPVGFDFVAIDHLNTVGDQPIGTAIDKNATDFCSSPNLRTQ